MRALAWLGALAALAVVQPAEARPVFTGRLVGNATRGAIDTVNGHLQLLQLQARDRSPQTYLGLTMRWAPGDVLLADGETFGANLTRGRMNLGLGGGDLGSFAWFLGADLEGVSLLNAGDSLFLQPFKDWEGPDATQGFYFLGVSILDVQATLGLRKGLGSESKDLDADGNFTAGAVDSRRRVGAPSVAQPGVDSAYEWGNDATVLSLYENRTGAFVSLAWTARTVWESTGEGVTRRYVDAGRKTGLNELRVNIQPLEYLLPRWFGLPALGLRKLQAALDVYQESASTTGRAAGVGPDEREARGDPFELDLGADDLLELGLRYRLVAQVRPDVRFRSLEVGYVDELPVGEDFRLRAGARTIIFDRAGKLVPSGDAFVSFEPFRFEEDREGGINFGVPLSVAVSYSYNSPDSTTFVPIPDAHVFGFQAVLGHPETSRPLIPFVREGRAYRGDR
jgi:hypothetical protein